MKLGDELSDSPKRMTVAAERPAIVCRCSLALPPWIDRSVKVSPAVPPTSWEVSELALVLSVPVPLVAPRIMPGCSAARLMPRRPVGMLSMTSLVTTFCTEALCTSTSGVSPVTVIVSASVPTFISALMVAVDEPVTSMPSRLTVLNPVSVNVTV